MSRSEAVCLIPLVCNIIQLVADNIPKLALSIEISHIDDTISILSRTIPETDEASAIGFVLIQADLFL